MKLQEFAVMIIINNLLMRMMRIKETSIERKHIRKDAFIVTYRIVSYRLLLQTIQHYTNNSDNIISDYS